MKLSNIFLYFHILTLADFTSFYHNGDKICEIFYICVNLLKKCLYILKKNDIIITQGELPKLVKGSHC